MLLIMAFDAYYELYELHAFFNFHCISSLLHKVSNVIIFKFKRYFSLLSFEKIILTTLITLLFAFRLLCKYTNPTYILSKGICHHKLQKSDRKISRMVTELLFASPSTSIKSVDSRDILPNFASVLFFFFSFFSSTRTVLLKNFSIPRKSHRVVGAWEQSSSCSNLAVVPG